MSYSKIKSAQRLAFCDIFGAHSVQFNSKHNNISWVFHMLPGAFTDIVLSAVVNYRKRTPNISAPAKKLIKFGKKLIEYSFFVKFAARGWGFPKLCLAVAVCSWRSELYSWSHSAYKNILIPYSTLKSIRWVKQGELFTAESESYVRFP